MCILLLHTSTETKVTTNDDKSTVHSLTDSSIVPQNLIPKMYSGYFGDQYTSLGTQTQAPKRHLSSVF